MTRRQLLLLPLAMQLRAADPEEQVFDFFADLASDLSQSNLSDFMAGFDPSMPSYEDLRANVAGLLEQAELQNSLEFQKNEGSDAARAVEIDWFMQIRLRDDTEAITRRREIVKCSLHKVRKHWKIFSLTPQSLFAPPPVK